MLKDTLRPKTLNNVVKATINHPFGNGLYHRFMIPPTYGDDWGMVYGIVLTTLHEVWYMSKNDLGHFEWWKYERKFGKKLSSYREIGWGAAPIHHGTPFYLVPSFLMAGMRLKGIVYSIFDPQLNWSMQMKDVETCWNMLKPLAESQKRLY